MSEHIMSHAELLAVVTDAVEENVDTLLYSIDDSDETSVMAVSRVLNMLAIGIINRNIGLQAAHSKRDFAAIIQDMQSIIDSSLPTAEEAELMQASVELITQNHNLQ